MKAKTWLKKNFMFQESRTGEATFDVYQVDKYSEAQNFMTEEAAYSYAKELKEKDPDIKVYIDKKATSWITFLERS